MGRVSGTSKQLRVAREAGSVTSCLARTPPRFARDVFLVQHEPQCRVAWPQSTLDHCGSCRVPLREEAACFASRLRGKRRRRQRTMLVAVKAGRQTMWRGGAQREFSLPRSGAERHYACRAQGPPSTGKHESEKGAARQVTLTSI